MRRELAAAPCPTTAGSEVVFGYQTLASFIRPEYAVMVENGATYLFIDDACNDYVYRPDYAGAAGAWTDVRTGRLTGDELAELNDAVLVQPWGSFPSPGVAEVDTFLWYGPDATWCGVECDGAVMRLFWTLQPWIERLYEQGRPHEGPMRVEVIDVARAPNGQGNFVEWTGEARLRDLVRPEAEILQPGDWPILDGADAARVREIREELRNGPRGFFTHQYLELSQDGEYFAMYARETIPFESPQGLFRAPR